MNMPAALSHHFEHVIVPLWRGPGFNASLRLPYEALDAAAQPLPVTRYRTMACARQLYVFAQHGDAGHAHTLFDALLHYFEDRSRGGWFFSVDAHGTPLDTTKDLYTHAFVVFACAAYGQRFAERAALDVARRTSALIVERFGNGAGLYLPALDARFAPLSDTPLQNPLMHLAEAWLAAAEATGDTAFDERLAEMVTSFAATFVHAQTGCVLELPQGHADNRIEPGHQFEWCWLAGRAARRIGATPLDAALARAFDFAVRHGVDPDTGGVAASLDERGRVVDATQRLWAQTEYLRAIATHADGHVQAQLPRQAARYAQRFLRDYGWIECLDAHGTAARVDMPSTTPYHMLSAYLALPVRATA